ncbi:stress enhanced protein 2, chloroplastic [Andrographis paniculata]|uniref:stress enhanced protein 2, chloroplastic n=1 Tax=Andrographis paniculata TaxID=175694 RepID=UPI0021E84342|nr:stress enhanced protein 2, chloroplastic [Andrographis paniculata]
MALTAARPPLFCRIRAGAEKVDSEVTQKVKLVDVAGKVVLQPRVCTLRSFADDSGGRLIRADDGDDRVSPFFEVLTDYVESSKKSHDFEIISGRLAMIVFAATVGMEIATGNSIFRKLEIEGLEEGAGVCLAAVASAAVFAWFSSNRSRVGRVFSVGCNSLIDSVIDHIVDGLFYEAEEWSDDEP